MSIFFVCILVLSVSCQNCFIDAAYSVDDTQLLQLDSQNSTLVSLDTLLTSLLTVVNGLLENVLTLLTGLLTGVVTLLSGVLGLVLSLVIDLLSQVEALLITILNVVNELLVSTTSTISDTISTLLDSIGSLASNITSTLAEILSAAEEDGQYAAVKPELETATDSMNEIEVDLQKIQGRIGGNGSISMALFVS